MKKLLFLFALVPFLGFAQQTRKKPAPVVKKVPVIKKADAPKGPHFVITGKVAGLSNGLVRIVSTSNDRKVIASDSSRGGSFRLVGSVPEPGLYFIAMGKEQDRYIFLENRPIQVSGTLKDIRSLKVEGSPANDDFIAFNNVFSPIVAQLNYTAMGLQREADPGRRDSLLRSYEQVTGVLRQQTESFVGTHTASYVSPFLLWQVRSMVPDVLWMESNFQKLDTSLARSEYGKLLQEYITFSKIGAVGTESIDFTQTDTSGKPVTLSSFRGKYVLVDFWASWCRPCRIENPNVVKAFHRFKDKNFTVLGVSLDQKKEPWVQAIQADSLAWTHVSDLQYWNNAAAQLYRIQSIPGNMLIDPSGRIIAKDLRGEDLQRKLCELLGCE